MAEKDIARYSLHAGIAIRSGLKAGTTMCYQQINGIWYPIIDPNNPPVPPPVTPTTPNPNVQWLNCQSCQGSMVSDQSIQNATCEVCQM
jgi:hypothetical protein